MGYLVMQETTDWKVAKETILYRVGLRTTPTFSPAPRIWAPILWPSLAHLEAKTPLIFQILALL